MEDMTAYDPLTAPDPREWQELDEFERIELVSAYHREAGVELPNVLLHAAIHVTVENQVLLGVETPVQATLERLMLEGLDRHDALHAIANVLVDHMQDLLRGTAPPDGPKEAYYEKLRTLTAEGWRQLPE
jgi:hypothetical protein